MKIALIGCRLISGCIIIFKVIIDCTARNYHWNKLTVFGILDFMLPFLSFHIVENIGQVTISIFYNICHNHKLIFSMQASNVDSIFQPHELEIFCHNHIGNYKRHLRTLLSICHPNLKINVLQLGILIIEIHQFGMVNFLLRLIAYQNCDIFRI